MPQVKIIAKNFMDMVASLPAMKLDKLYENAFICEAILRSLLATLKPFIVSGRIYNYKAKIFSMIKTLGLYAIVLDTRA